MNSLLLQIFWSQSSLFQWVHTVRTDSGLSFSDKLSVPDTADNAG